MLAQALAKEAGLPLIHVSAAVLCSKWVGDSEKVRGDDDDDDDDDDGGGGGGDDAPAAAAAAAAPAVAAYADNDDALCGASWFARFSRWRAA
jgi:hypothetical protein